MIKINLGCGLDYKKGWINVDYNKDIKADVYCDINKRLPFHTDYADVVLMDNVLEHVDDIFKVMEEIHRICKNKGKVIIYVPHYSSPNALKLPYHTFYFGISSMDFIKYGAGMNKTYKKLNFIVEEERLSLFQRNYYQKGMGFISNLNFFNFIFNFGKLWKLLMERLWIFGFDEIKYTLEAKK